MEAALSEVAENQLVPYAEGPDYAEESELIRTITALAREKQFVLIDLKSTSSRTVSRAFARSDLVLIPPQPLAHRRSLGDRSGRLVREEYEVLQRTIPYCLACVRSNSAIVTRDQTAIVADLGFIWRRRFREQGGFIPLVVEPACMLPPPLDTDTDTVCHLPKLSSHTIAVFNCRHSFVIRLSCALFNWLPKSTRRPVASPTRN